MNYVIPTVFVKNKKDFESRLEKLRKVSNNLQVDFMDGKFVKTKGIMPEDIPNLKKYNNSFEAHLMTKNPEKYIGLLKKKGFERIIFHYEAMKSSKEIEELIRKIKKAGLEVVLAVNPETPISKIVIFLHEVDGTLFLGVHPGREHQSFISEVYKKIRELRKFNKKIKIQVDGGVNFDVARKLREVGVNRVNSGSFVVGAKNPEETIKKLNEILR